MRKIKLPIVGRELRIYYGAKEFEDYKKACIALGLSKEDAQQLNPNHFSGHCVSDVLWVKDPKDMIVIIHEMTHLIDNLIENIGLEGVEIKAYLTEWLMVEILGGQKIPTRKEVQNKQDKWYSVLFKEVKS